MFGDWLVHEFVPAFVEVVFDLGDEVLLSYYDWSRLLLSGFEHLIVELSLSSDVRTLLVGLLNALLFFRVWLFVLNQTIALLRTMS